ncbi:MAG: ATP phosphoribosyltransferase regulatory subunit [Gammaproteobacteria bacterium RBG_16_51_14]|nr:MAG: ATP phosphoribosyltransferase regulatory subunit [Gammaproteobacteria bacterium RBG_16_51_14]
MTDHQHWLLPEGIEEILPPRAARLEQLCRELIDLYTSWGYELVIPPLIEYLETLLTGTGEDLDLQVFKLTDQLSGRLMGIRADTTPQVARIDAHILKRNVPTRLCYLGSVLHTRPDGTGGSRSPLQVGAELYGHTGVASDAEVLSLMLETLKVSGIEKAHIDMGHVGIYRALMHSSGLDTDRESRVFDILQRKAVSELKQMFSKWDVPAGICRLFADIMDLNGDIAVLSEARQRLKNTGPEVMNCLDELERIADAVSKQTSGTALHFDLAELRGYHYHTGVIFTAFVPGRGQGIAYGGRYDDIGKSFGRARPATGFSTDIKCLLAHQTDTASLPMGIFAPCSGDPGLLKCIKELRQNGEIVICELPGQTGGPAEMNCDRKLMLQDGNWKMVKV